MRVDDDEGPPSYAALHGRVLGTGEAVNVPAPRGVNMVNRQDMEDELFGEEEGQFFHEDHYDSDDNPIEGDPNPTGR